MSCVARRAPLPAAPPTRAELLDQPPSRAPGLAPVVDLVPLQARQVRDVQQRVPLELG